MMTKKTLLLFPASVVLLLTSGGVALRAQQTTPPPPPSPLAPLAPVQAPPATRETPPTPPTAPAAPEAPALAAVVAPDEFSFSFNGPGNYLGVQTEEIGNENLSRYGLQRGARGVGVAKVIKDSPAERAGLKENDVILRFDGEAVTSIRKLNRLIGEAAPEQTARLTISRGGAEQELSVTLSRRQGFSKGFGTLAAPQAIEELRRLGEQGGRQSGELRRQSEEMRRLGEGARREMENLRRDNPQLFKDGRGFNFNFGAGRRIGVSTTPLTEQLAIYFGIGGGGRGLLVTSVNDNTPAAKAGLKAGDIITAVNGKSVGEAGELSRALNDQGEGAVTLTIVRDKKERAVTLTPEKSQAPVFELSPISISVPRVRITTPTISIAPRIKITPKVVTRSPVL
ncbi:MAG: PDZ domain-containing protein [Pyrinomonadaceae bacterium]|nr:PDZ domain-containing protein [Pyrinomonadaceae bacterium]